MSQPDVDFSVCDPIDIGHFIAACPIDAGSPVWRHDNYDYRVTSGRLTSPPLGIALCSAKAGDWISVRLAPSRL